MKGCEALLLLLLCLSGTEAQGHNGLLNERDDETSDIWAALMAVTDMVVVQQEKMKIMEARTAASEEEAKRQGLFIAGKHGHNGAGRNCKVPG